MQQRNYYETFAGLINLVTLVLAYPITHRYEAIDLPISQAIDDAAPKGLAPMLNCSKLPSWQNSGRLEPKDQLNEATADQRQLYMRPSLYPPNGSEYDGLALLRFHRASKLLLFHKGTKKNLV